MGEGWRERWEGVGEAHTEGEVGKREGERGERLVEVISKSEIKKRGGEDDRLVEALVEQKVGEKRVQLYRAVESRAKREVRDG